MFNIIGISICFPIPKLKFILFYFDYKFIERNIALRKYKNQNGDIVEFTYFSNGINGGSITTTFVSLPQLSASYSFREEAGITYLKIMNTEYVFILKEIDDKRITAFDLFKGNEVIHSFTFFVN